MCDKLSELMAAELKVTTTELLDNLFDRDGMAGISDEDSLWTDSTILDNIRGKRTRAIREDVKIIAKSYLN